MLLQHASHLTLRQAGLFPGEPQSFSYLAHATALD